MKSLLLGVFITSKLWNDWQAWKWNHLLDICPSYPPAIWALALNTSPEAKISWERSPGIIQTKPDQPVFQVNKCFSSHSKRLPGKMGEREATRRAALDGTPGPLWEWVRHRKANGDRVRPSTEGRNPQFASPSWLPPDHWQAATRHGLSRSTHLAWEKRLKDTKMGGDPQHS